MAAIWQRHGQRRHVVSRRVCQSFDVAVFDSDSDGSICVDACVLCVCVSECTENVYIQQATVFILARVCSMVVLSLSDAC